MKNNKYILVVTLVILIILCSCSMGCEKEEEDIGISKGYSRYVSTPMSPDSIGIKSSKSLFQIDAVELTFSYGWWNSMREEYDTSRKIQLLQLYFYNHDAPHNKILIKEITDYNSNKYAYDLVLVKESLEKGNGPSYGNLIYACNEVFKVPAELFINTEGHILLYAEGIDMNYEDNPKDSRYKVTFYNSFGYTVDGTQVKITA